MFPMNFIPVPIRIPPEYLIGSGEQELAAFRQLLPPFVDVEFVEEASPEYDDIETRSVFFDVGENFQSNIHAYVTNIIEEEMGEATKKLPISSVVDTGAIDADERKLGIPLLKRLIGDVARDEDAEYVKGVSKAYVIHPPALRDELKEHLSHLPIPPMYADDSERLVSLCVGGENRSFVLAPYEMDIDSHRSNDPRWVMVLLFNSDMPPLGIKIGVPKPLNFKEPTPLLSDTEIAEKWAMGVLGDTLRDSGHSIQYRHEPNGPNTFPDFAADINGVDWDIEVTRVMGDILQERHILNNPRNSRKMFKTAVHKPSIVPDDAREALQKAIESKKRERSAGEDTRYGLVLLNSADLDIGEGMPAWQQTDLASFDAVVLIHGYSQPTVEFIKGKLTGDPES